ncbi:MAG: DUF2332 family protein [Chloroflexi bacterium]|nr:MAG: DUF2332 family protein [Chloroflexota bacterium]
MGGGARHPAPGDPAREAAKGRPHRRLRRLRAAAPGPVRPGRGGDRQLPALHQGGLPALRSPQRGRARGSRAARPRRDGAGRAAAAQPALRSRPLPAAARGEPPVGQALPEPERRARPGGGRAPGLPRLLPAAPGADRGPAPGTDSPDQRIGASAGLNLLGDRYCVAYGDRLLGDPHSAVRIDCRLKGDLRPPLETAPIAWRLGVDRNPIDVTDAEQALWLRALVWPDQPWRAELLLAAIRVAQEDPAEVLRGDALDLLPEIIARVPADTALCLYSSFTLYQLGPSQRATLDRIVERAADSRPVHRLELEWHPGEKPYLELESFGDGPRRRVRLASAHDHGAWLEWLDRDSATV